MIDARDKDAIYLALLGTHAGKQFLTAITLLDVAVKSLHLPHRPELYGPELSTETLDIIAQVLSLLRSTQDYTFVGPLGFENGMLDLIRAQHAMTDAIYNEYAAQMEDISIASEE